MGSAASSSAGRSSCVLRHPAVRWHHRPGSTEGPDPRRASGGATTLELEQRDPEWTSLTACGRQSRGKGRLCYPAPARLELARSNSSFFWPEKTFPIPSSEPIRLLPCLFSGSDTEHAKTRSNLQATMADANGTAKPKKSLVLNAFVEMCTFNS